MQTNLEARRGAPRGMFEGGLEARKPPPSLGACQSIQSPPELPRAPQSSRELRKAPKSLYARHPRKLGGGPGSCATHRSFGEAPGGLGEAPGGLLRKGRPEEGLEAPRGGSKGGLEAPRGGSPRVVNGSIEARKGAAFGRWAPPGGGLSRPRVNLKHPLRKRHP